MKKIKMIVSCLFMALILCGCDKAVVDTFADVSNSSDNVNSSRGNQLTVGEIYNYIRENNDLEISENLMKTIMKTELDFDDEDIEDLYNKYLNEEFKTRFVDSGSYNYDGKFNENLVCEYLRSEGYKIVCENTNASNPLDKTYFTFDYSDYIEKELNYDIYLKMLKVQYIIDEKPQLINKNNGRLISYYSVTRSSSTDVETRKKLEEQLNKIYNSQSETKKITLADIANEKRDEELSKIDEELEKISTSSDDTFKYLGKYTTCGNKKCTLEQGEAYQKKIINDTNYFSSEVVINTNTSVLFEGAREVLFGNNVSDYLYDGLDKNLYLMSPAYENDGSKPNINDIIIFDGSSTYYVVMVEIIDATSNFDKQALVAEKLLDTVSESNVFDYYFDEVDIEIYDKQIREYFISKYGEY